MTDAELVQQTEELSVKEEDDVINPWEVASKSDSGVDYDKLIGKYNHVLFSYHFSKLNIVN
jgi:hypothetical protein